MLVSAGEAEECCPNAAALMPDGADAHSTMCNHVPSVHALPELFTVILKCNSSSQL